MEEHNGNRVLFLGEQGCKVDIVRPEPLILNSCRELREAVEMLLSFAPVQRVQRQSTGTKAMTEIFEQIRCFVIHVHAEEFGPTQQSIADSRL